MSIDPITGICLCLAFFILLMVFFNYLYTSGREVGVAVTNYKYRHIMFEARALVVAENRYNELLGQFDNELSEEAQDILDDAQRDAEQDMIVSIVRLELAMLMFDGKPHGSYEGCDK